MFYQNLLEVHDSPINSLSKQNKTSHLMHQVVQVPFEGVLFSLYLGSVVGPSEKVKPLKVTLMALMVARNEMKPICKWKHS